jgi:hypothetical protein
MGDLVETDEHCYASLAQVILIVAGLAIGGWPCRRAAGGITSSALASTALTACARPVGHSVSSKNEKPIPS